MQTQMLSDEWIRSQEPIDSVISTLVTATRTLVTDCSACSDEQAESAGFASWVWDPVVSDAPGVDLHALSYAQSCEALTKVADATYRTIVAIHPRDLPRTSPVSDRIGRHAIERGVSNHAVAHSFGTSTLMDPQNTPRDTYIANPSATLSVRVADGRIGMVGSRRGRYGLLVSTQPRFVQACSRYIEAAQSIGRPVQPSWRNPEISPTVRQLRILRLLCDGETDASSAGKLGVSDRLVRREIAELYTMFNVQSRFELGVAYSTWMAGR